MRFILNKKPVFWLLLSIPGIVMAIDWWRGRIDAMDLLHPTGEFSARFMIVAMMLGPLTGLMGGRRWVMWLLARRRSLGVAAFGYAVLHLIFYLIDMGNLDDILAEILAPGIWTGWAAFALFVPMAATSNDRAMRAMKTGWKRLQRLAYPAALLTLLHWFWIHNGYGPAIVHFAPLGLIWLALLAKTTSSTPTHSKGIS